MESDTVAPRQVKQVLGNLASIVNHILRAGGYELRRYDYGNTAFQAKKALMDHRLDTVIDVGANCGQYGSMIVHARPDVALHSFEPLPDAFKTLEKLGARHEKWRTYNVALGKERSQQSLIVASNSQSSSLLAMSPLLLQSAPECAPVSRIHVPVEPIDVFMDNFGNEIFLKMDAQGYEAEILRGGVNVLKRSRYVQLEVSFAELYEGAPRPHTLIQQMYESGFEIYTVNPVFSDRQSGRLLQGDILFCRPT